MQKGFPGGTVVKNPPPNTGDTRDMGSIHGLRRFPGAGNDNQLQCSCLENPTDRGDSWATVHGVTELDTTERLTLLLLECYDHKLLDFCWTLYQMSSS